MEVWVLSNAVKFRVHEFRSSNISFIGQFYPQYNGISPYANYPGYPGFDNYDREMEWLRQQNLLNLEAYNAQRYNGGVYGAGGYGGGYGGYGGGIIQGPGPIQRNSDTVQNSDYVVKEREGFNRGY